MFSKEDKDFAIEYYEACEMSVTETIRDLGYPPNTTMRRWLNEKGIPLRNLHKKGIPQPISVKVEAVRRCYELGESLSEMASELGLSGGGVISNWYKNLTEKGVISLMTKEDLTERNAVSVQSPEQDIDLGSENERLRMENDILKEVISILKKDRGVDPTALANKEKAIVIGALRTNYPLKNLLMALSIPRSSYYYCTISACKPDKYIWLREEVRDIFYENANRYGAERIWQVLRNREIIVSAKVVRRIMREEHLSVISKKKASYKSYQGEISPAPKNLINRDFSSTAPNRKWLTDITEMKALDGKVYLSPIIDCFDGMVVGHTRGLHPTSDLTEIMLKNAIAKLGKDEHPVVHSDRGCHYRWPKWIELMNDSELIRSMSSKGCSPDNSACEGFFGRMKNEMYYGRGWEQRTAEELIAAVDTYIVWYNSSRIKMSLGGKSIIQYRLSLGLAA
jgi:transposase InsO family protein/transposase-like protein